MKKVYFNLRKNSRERMWDTSREAKRVCEPLTSGVEQKSSVARAGLRGGKATLSQRVKQILFRLLPLINYQAVPNSEAADLLYMWGAFPRGSNKPFVIEMDNPFVLTYYKKFAFRLRLPELKRKLRRAARLTFLSETARHHFLELFGTEFRDKSIAIPPFMERNYKNTKRPNDGIVRFLFVGLGFRRKGGPEVLHAFSKLPYENARLTVVAPIDEKLNAQYAGDKRITFLPPQSREVLFEELYPQSDVLVFPSLHETLGVVALEALSFGMGIITTNLYATPELVKDKINGRLLPHPFIKPTMLDGVSVIDCVTPERKDFEEAHLRGAGLYQELSGNILEAMKEAMGSYKSWQEKSIEHFESNFSPDIWERRFEQAIAS